MAVLEMVPSELMQSSVVRAICEERSTVYRMLARLFDKEIDEDAARVITALALESEPLSSSDGRESFLLESGVATMARAVSRFDACVRDSLACDYARVFLAVGAKKDETAAPYESVHTSETGLMMQEARDEVRVVFRAHGIMPDAGGAVPEDYLPYELEFMALLSDRLLAALAANDSEAVGCLLDEQEAFLKGHLLNWFDAFAGKVRAASQTEFYRGLVDFAEGYLEYDREMLETMSVAVKGKVLLREV